MARLLTGVPVAVVVAGALAVAFVGLERAHIADAGRLRGRWAVAVLAGSSAVVAVAIARFVYLP
jgi:hypothetical protein